MREGSGVEKHLTHHLYTVPDVVYAHPVDHKVNEEIGCLDLKLGCRNLPFLFLIRVERHAVVNYQNRKHILDCHNHCALLEKIGKVLVRVLVFPLVLECHRKESGAVHVSFILKA